MARRWYGALLGCWLVTALPVFVVLMLLFSGQPMLLFFLLWWSKPLHERLPLWLLSRVIFGAVPSVLETAAQWRQALLPQCAQTLTWRRLSATRSLDMPVAVLEHLGGAARRQRLGVLHRSNTGPASWLTILGVHIEGFLQLAGMLLLFLLVPTQAAMTPLDLLDVIGASSMSTAFGALLVFAIMGLVAPFYVAGGFAMYLNRRTELEAWDIELKFRALRDRFLSRRRSSVPTGALLVLLCALLTVPEIGRAEIGELESDVHLSRAAPFVEARDQIETIKAGEHFNQVRTYQIPKFLRDWFERDADVAVTREWELQWLASVIRFVATAGQAALWVGLAVLLIWLAWQGWRRADWLSKRHRNSRPVQVLGMTMDQRSLPEDPAAQARSLWRAGRQRDALALLLQATLIYLIDKEQCPLLDSDTELDCLHKAGSTFGGECLQAVLALWLPLAYAHRPAEQTDFDQLCNQLVACGAI